MNDHLKTLAKHCGIWFEDTKDIRTHSVSTTTLEKFAESIILECADVAHRNTRDGSHLHNIIKQHFGVKE